MCSRRSNPGKIARTPVDPPLRWVAALHGWLKEVWAGYYEKSPSWYPDEAYGYRNIPWDINNETYVDYKDRHEEWSEVWTELIPTEKGEKYESVFESWIRMKTTPYQFGLADLKATHWMLSVLTKRSIAIKCEWVPYTSHSHLSLLPSRFLISRFQTASLTDTGQIMQSKKMMLFLLGTTSYLSMILPMSSRTRPRSGWALSTR